MGESGVREKRVLVGVVVERSSAIFMGRVQRKLGHTMESFGWTKMVRFGGCARLVFGKLLPIVTKLWTTKKEREEDVIFYLRAGGACLLYTCCQALPAQSPFRFRRCAASVLASRLPSGKVPFRRGVSGKVLFWPGAARQHPA